MKFEDLKIAIKELSPQWHGDWKGEFLGVTNDSRKVKTGYIFASIMGTTNDEHKYIGYINEAIRRGAKGIILSQNFKTSFNQRASKSELLSETPLVFVDDVRKAHILLLRIFYNNPQKKLKFIGITGTNGKTSTSHILWSIFKTAGIKAGLIGTIGYALDDGIYHKIPLTTPNPEDLWAIFDEMGKNKISIISMEVSSHALHQGRVWGIDFAYAIFTNLTQDHLDYHRTMDEYLSAKSILFNILPYTSTAIVNVDDPASNRIISANKGKLLTYGIKNNEADVNVENFSLSWNGIDCLVRSPWGKIEIQSNLVGKFNIYNIVASYIAAKLENISDELIVRSLSKVKHIKGRFEKVDMGQPFTILIDYAHTPDALKNIIQSVKELSDGKLIVVFGAGGDRDKTKRPIMGKIATELADFAIITSDNPRSEDPQEIIEMIKEGTVGKNYKTIVDRREAIYEAIKMAKIGDVVVIAGKGHEDYQILRDRIIHFDDREVVMESLKSLGWYSET